MFFFFLNYHLHLSLNPVTPSYDLNFKAIHPNVPPALKMKSIPPSFCLLSSLQRSDRPPQLPRTVSPCHSRQNKIVPSVSGEAKLTFSRNDNKSHYFQSPYFSVSWTVVETNWFSRRERDPPTRWLHMKMTPVIQRRACECSCSLLLPAFIWISDLRAFIRAQITWIPVEMEFFFFHFC